MLDLIFALPLLAYVALPCFIKLASDYNFVFFSWIAWWAIMKAYSNFQLEMITTTWVRAFFLVFSLLAFLFDEFFPLASMVFKTQGFKGLPGRRRRVRLRLREIKVAFWAVFNVLVSHGLFVIYEYCKVIVFHRQSLIAITAKWPHPGTANMHILIGLTVWEISSYLIHRFILHNRFFYFFEYPHRMWYHGLRNVYPLTNSYDHPFVYFIHKCVPLYLPLAFVRFHLLEWIIYVSIILLVETISHCGYKRVPPLPFLKGIAIRTQIHVEDIRHPCFGPWGLMDLLFGTLSYSWYNLNLGSMEESQSDTPLVNGNPRPNRRDRRNRADSIESFSSTE